MFAVETVAETALRSRSEADLVVDPSDISFQDLTRDTVMIQVKIRNDGEHRSSPTVMRLESAPFGAFVSWSPLATLPVPPLEPGESQVLSVKAARPHPAALGDFDRVPPRRVLTALNAAPEEAPRQPVDRLAALLSWTQRKKTKGPALPADLWELFGREQPHWAGNINVFVGQRAVERHVAKALRIFAGRTNLAMFVVGSVARRDAYAFNLVGVAPDWKAGLYDASNASTLVVSSTDTPIREKQWVEAGAGLMMVMLAVRPPLVCEDGNLQVHVTRRSCQKTAVVEFSLNPTAQGPGCYVA